jgi:hypothetical protein
VRYRGEVSQGFRKALGSLTPNRRLLLRQHSLDGLHVQTLARLHQVEQAVAEQWLSAARTSAVAALRTQLETLQGVREEDVRLVARLVRQRLEIPPGHIEEPTDAGPSPLTALAAR